MNYFLFKLQFDTAVHFGGGDSALSLYTSEEALRADTLFSTLCHETLVQHGEEALEQLCAQVRQRNVLPAKAHCRVRIHRGGRNHPA